jgi:hypothetical protein
MKIRTNIKAGSLNYTKIEFNHNEKLADDNSSSIEQKESISRWLLLSKETVRELRDSEQKLDGHHTYCPPFDSWMVEK